jgi:hypothetical protein
MMGLFKIKGNNRADARTVFQQFSTRRRLSNIAEEDAEADLDNDAAESGGTSVKSMSNKRKNTPNKIRITGTPNKNKNTPDRIKHPFHRLVEWDYSDNATGTGKNQNEPYEPPQDFMHVQRERGNEFFQNGPERSQMVKVRKSTTMEDATKVHAKWKAQKEHPSDSGTLKIFQFAADTASLSKSCSSDSSSVCSASVASKNSFRTSFNERLPALPLDAAPTITSNVNTPPETRSQRRVGEKKTCRAKTANVQNDAKTSKIPKLSAPRVTTTRVASPHLKRAVQTSASALVQVYDARKAPELVTFSGTHYQEFVDFSTEMEQGKQEAFGDIDWPSKPTKGILQRADKKEWPSENLDLDDTVTAFTQITEKPDTKFVLKTGDNYKESSTSTEARGLVERSKALFNDTQSLTRDEKPRETSSRKLGNNGDSKNHWSSVGEHVDEAERSYKENERSGPSFSNNSIFRNKKVQFEKKGTSPLMKIPSNDADAQDQARSAVVQRKVLPEHNNCSIKPVPQSHRTGDYMTPQQHKEGHPNLSLRFEHGNPGSRGYHSEPRHRGKPSIVDSRRQDASKNHLPVKRALDLSNANLGAMPMMSTDSSSSTSMHLFMDRMDSYDNTLSKKGSFASTIESTDSQSTASSVSTFVESSPRGIRGSFPTQMVPSSSSLSLSTGSSSFLNEVDFFTSSRGPGTAGSRRPPTGVPPTSIFGSMLFQTAGEHQDGTAATTASRSISPKLETARGVPNNIQADDDAAISDVTGSTVASEWMIQGNKLLNRFYYNAAPRDGLIQKKQKLSRQLRQRETQYLENCQNKMAGILKEQRSEIQKRPINAFVSEFDTRNDPLDKMRRHQHQFQYPHRNLRSGFDNQHDTDNASLFEA